MSINGIGWTAVFYAHTVHKLLKNVKLFAKGLVGYWRMVYNNSVYMNFCASILITEHTNKEFIRTDDDRYEVSHECALFSRLYSEKQSKTV